MTRLSCLFLLAALAGAEDLAVVQTFRPDFEVAQWRLRDINGNGRTELLLVAAINKTGI